MAQNLFESAAADSGSVVTKFLSKATSGSAEVTAHALDISVRSVGLFAVVVGSVESLGQEVGDVSGVGDSHDGKKGMNCGAIADPR